MQDQRVIRLKLDCLKPSFLALTPGVHELWLDTCTESTYNGFMVRPLYSLVLSRRRRRDVKETNGNLRHSWHVHRS